MKRILLIMLVALMLTGCAKTNVKDKPEVYASDTAEPTAEPEVLVDEQAPLIFDGEDLYESWAYTFTDIDGNGIAERVSFTNIHKETDTENDITARLAIEFDFASKNSEKDIVYIERKGGTILHPEIQCSIVSGETLIFVKDPYAITGEELYPFTYTTSGALSEMGFGTSKQFPNNAFSKAAICDLSSLKAYNENNSKLAVTYAGAMYYFVPEMSDEQYLSDSYDFEFKKKENLMSFEPESQTIFYGMSAMMIANPQNVHATDSGKTDELSTIPVDIIITFQYNAGAFAVRDVTVMNVGKHK